MVVHVPARPASTWARVLRLSEPRVSRMGDAGTPTSCILHFRNGRGACSADITLADPELVVFYTTSGFYNCAIFHDSAPSARGLHPADRRLGYLSYLPLRPAFCSRPVSDVFLPQPAAWCAYGHFARRFLALARSVLACVNCHRGIASRAGGGLGSIRTEPEPLASGFG